MDWKNRGDLLEHKPRIWIVGASSRAAAFSALRAGYCVTAIDLFADADLCARATAIRVPSLTSLREPTWRPSAGSPWMYTGGLENDPELVAKWSEQSELLGNGADVLRQVRSPEILFTRLAAAGWPTLPWSLSPEGVASDGSWVSKRVASGGGLGVANWYGTELEEPTPPLDALETDGRSHGPSAMNAVHYYQARGRGPALAGAYLGNGETAVLLGVTRQITGAKWLGAARYHYSGSVGPLALSPAQQSEWDALGKFIAAEFGLVGLFGIDALVQGSRPQVLEVNPRYTASMELIERASGHAGVGEHITVCRTGVLPRVYPTLATSDLQPALHGKAIVYARRTGITDRGAATQLVGTQALGHARVADVPHPGTTIRVGEPIVSVFASGASIRQVALKLRQEARACWKEIYKVEG